MIRLFGTRKIALWKIALQTIAPTLTLTLIRRATCRVGGEDFMGNKFPVIDVFNSH